VFPAATATRKPEPLTVNHPFSAYSQKSNTSYIPLGKVFGITVQAHWSWLIVPLLFISVGGGFAGLAYGLLVCLVLFGCVFLHELGHSMVAKHYGIQVLDITFWPLGGMARMSELPEDPKIEGMIAIAGPLVNFALIALAIPLYIGLGISGFEGVALLVVGFMKLNLVLGAFNLIPAFPMDGGRVLRAFLGRTRDWVTATEIAVKTGRIATIVMMLVALYKGPSMCVMFFIAAFIWYAGTRELWAVRMRHGISPLGNFGGASPFEKQASNETWAEPAEAEFEAHSGFEGDVEGQPERQPGRGFSDKDLKRLEQFHGRLRRPSDEE
jgi:Zn-dependent protease